MSKFHIQDWAGNDLTAHGEFDSFEEAEECLSVFLGDSYEEDRGEYEIMPIDDEDEE